MKDLENRFANGVIKSRFFIIVLSICLLIVGLFGLKQLHFTTDYRIYFSDDNPELIAFETMEKVFSKKDNVLIVIEPENGDIFTQTNLAILKEITDLAWQTPYSSRVDSITNHQHTESIEDDVIVADLVSSTSDLDTHTLEKIRRIATTEPQLVDQLVSPSGHVAGINITVQSPGIDKDKETPEIVNHIKKITNEIKAKYPEINIYLSGLIMMNNAFSDSAKKDFTHIVPLSFALMLLILALMVGGIMGTLCSLLVIAFSILVAMGIGALLGYPLSPPSISAPTIILTIAIANCVHILANMNYEYSLSHNKLESIIESLRVNLQPISIASITTTFGFLAMNFSDVPPFRDLGNFVAIGVLTSLILSLTLLPALLSLVPIRRPKHRRGNSRSMDLLGQFVVKNHNTLFWAVSCLILVLIVSVPRNELNDIFVHYFDDTIEFRRDTNFINDNLTGLYNVAYTLDAGEESGINSPKFLQQTSSFTDWLRQQQEVTSVSSITDIMKRLNKNLHGDTASEYKLPSTKEMAAQYLLLYETSLPFGLDLTNQINIDKSSTLILVRTETISSQALIDFNQRALDWIANNAPDITSVQGTGGSLMFANIGQRNIKSMLLGTSITIIGISFVLILALRSFKIGLLSLIPNLVPAAMGFGLWGLMVGEIGLSLSIVATMTLGIVVDDTVHMLSKYLRARREKGLSSKDAVQYAFKTVGNALLTTSVILAAGFYLLSTSSFELNSGMGLLTSIVIIFALVADFFFLPPLLIKMEEHHDKKLVAASNISQPG